MARLDIAIQKPTPAGTTPTYTAATVDGVMFPARDSVMVIVKNTGGSASTVSIPTPATVGGRAVADDGGSVPATTGERWFGPFSREVHANSGADKGKVYLNAAPQAGVVYAVVEIS